MANLTTEEFKVIHQEWKQSGLSVREYCDNIGLKENRFYYWQHKIKTEECHSGTGSFVPMKMQGANRSIPGSANAPDNSALCEVVYPNGVTVRVTSDMTLEHLRQMITLFR